jgi:hypothetical protein
MGTRVGLIFRLSWAPGSAPEFVAVPEFDSGQTEGKSLFGNDQAGMHQYPADRMMPQPAILVAAAVDVLGKAEIVQISALAGELRRVLQQQERPLTRGISRLCRLEVAAQDIALLHLRVGEKPIRRLGSRPVLTGKRDRSSHSVAEAAQQICKPPAETDVLERTGINLALRPVVTQRQQFRFEPTLSTSPDNPGARDRITTDSFDSRFFVCRPRNDTITYG